MILPRPTVPPSIGFKTGILDFKQPVFMGILNLTPDSFSDGGRLTDIQSVLQQAETFVNQGARILDIGGESSRPGSQPVPLDEEKRRVLPAIEALANEKLPAFISIDTYKADVAQCATNRGACIINDISALGDPGMAEVAGRSGAALILMHMRGTPQTMQQGALHYDNLALEITEHLQSRIKIAVEAGVMPSKCMIDPGIGFGKTTAHNLQLTKDMRRLTSLGTPVVYGPSRKRFLGEITGRPVEDRDRATAAACGFARLAGAHIFRVHNVAATKDAIALADAMIQA